MNFKIFKFEGNEVAINTDRIISVGLDSKNGHTLITCTDQYIVLVDDTVEEVKKKLGIKKQNEGKVGFKPSEKVV